MEERLWWWREDRPPVHRPPLCLGNRRGGRDIGGGGRTQRENVPLAAGRGDSGVCSIPPAIAVPPFGIESDRGAAGFPDRGVQ